MVIFASLGTEDGRENIYQYSQQHHYLLEIRFECVYHRMMMMNQDPMVQDLSLDFVLIHREFSFVPCNHNEL